MNARSFSWQDILPLIRYGGNALCLDSCLRLTRGNPAGPGALIRLLRPSTGSYTAVIPSEGEQPTVIGQVVRGGEDFGAHVTFLLPENALKEQALLALLDMLTCAAVEMEAGALLLELEEDHAMFHAFRQAGFGVCAWQHLWKMPDRGTGSDARENPWRECEVKDLPAIQKLYMSVVPPLVQAVEPRPSTDSSGWVIGKNGDIQAFASGSFGTHGIVLRLNLHPESENEEMLVPMLMDQFSTVGRPVYVLERLYQAQLGSMLRELGAESSPLYALMAKQLLTRVKEPIAERVRRVVSGRQPEPTAPMSTFRE